MGTPFYNKIIRKQFISEVKSPTAPPPDVYTRPYINPTNPGYPYPLDPSEERVPRENAPPDPIAWDELDEIIEDFIRKFENFLNSLRLLTYEQIRAYFKRAFNIDIGMIYDPTDAWIIIWGRWESYLESWFDQRYPNATEEQRSTFLHRLEMFDERLMQLWELHLYPNTPGFPLNPYTPYGGADDPRYRDLDPNDSTTWGNWDPYDPFRFHWWQYPPNNMDDPFMPYPGVYSS